MYVCVRACVQVCVTNGELSATDQVRGGFGWVELWDFIFTYLYVYCAVLCG